jgi:SAM-dependent methyltransferase
LTPADSVLERERAYHEKLYSGFAQTHFARPAVRAFREHLAKRILHLAGAGRSSRVLSLGCGIGDTELLLAPHVGELVGFDLSPSAVRQARVDAERLNLRNVTFIEGTEPKDGDRFDVIIAIFLLHHLPDEILLALPDRLRAMFNPGGVFYSLDPSVRRLSGAIGRRLIPNMVKKYQTPDERELDPRATAELFREAGLPGAARNVRLRVDALRRLDSGMAARLSRGARGRRCPNARARAEARGQQLRDRCYSPIGGYRASRLRPLSLHCLFGDAPIREDQGSGRGGRDSGITSGP